MQHIPQAPDAAFEAQLTRIGKELHVSDRLQSALFLIAAEFGLSER
jgi:hypothetical protein